MNEPQTTETKLAEIALANASPESGIAHEVVYDLKDVSVSYGGVTAVGGVTLGVRENQVTALIGPSGCGKTTFLRCLNRMNDLIPGCRSHGELLSTARTSTAPASTPSSCAAGSAWCSRSRTRSRSRSTTTSPSRSGSTG